MQTLLKPSQWHEIIKFEGNYVPQISLEEIVKILEKHC